jgi:hypothetical protein
MALQNRAGTIILDAILTDTGRKRMAEGSFKIAKFSLGDDEIDYEGYNNTKAAVTDGEGGQILSTPVFEAFNAEHANINYGLISYARQDLYYIPELQINHRVTGALNPYQGSYYIAANDETHDKLKEGFGDTRYIARNEAVIGSKVIIESGINAQELVGTEEERNSYILDKQLLDRYYNVYCDNRYITNIVHASTKSKFKNYRDGTVIVALEPLYPAPPTSMTPAIEFYNTYIANGIHNQIWFYEGDPGTPARDVSAILGPRGSVVALNFTIDPRLTTVSQATRSYLYSVYGNINETIHPAVDGIDYKYDFIETTIYVEGITSAARVQVPLRIARYAGT